jgi:hypothetical protein
VRWARWRLQARTMAPGSVAAPCLRSRSSANSSMNRGERVERPENLTRGLLKRYRAYITAAGYSPAYRTSILVSLRVLLDDVRFNGWELRLASTATYLRGELPRGPKSLPRFIDELVMGQIEWPDNIARITNLTIRTAVYVLIMTGGALRRRVSPPVRSHRPRLSWRASPPLRQPQAQSAKRRCRSMTRSSRRAGSSRPPSPPASRPAAVGCCCPRVEPERRHVVDGAPAAQVDARVARGWRGPRRSWSAGEGPPTLPAHARDPDDQQRDSRYRDPPAARARQRVPTCTCGSALRRSSASSRSSRSV